MELSVIFLFLFFIQFINCIQINQQGIECSLLKLCPYKLNVNSVSLSQEELKKEEYHQCCSGEGYCGETVKFCGFGCQSGDCLVKSNTFQDENSSSTFLQSLTSSLTSPVLKKRDFEGRCGPGIGSCPSGSCCGSIGWCGTSEAFCYHSRGCQPLYGTCAGKCGPGHGSCPTGECCSKYGWCGKTEKYCSTSNGCQPGYGRCISSNPDLSIKCGPGYGNCPSNLCCSKYGWCGKTERYCSTSNGCQSSYGICSDSILDSYATTTNNYIISTTTTPTSTISTITSTTTSTITSTSTSKTTSTTTSTDTLTSTSKTTSTTTSTDTSTDTSTSISKTTSTTTSLTTSSTISTITSIVTSTTSTTTSTNDIEKITTIIKSSSTKSKPKIMAYLPNYRLYNSTNIETYDFSNIDVIYYCFFGVSNEGVVFSTDSYIDYDMGTIKYLNTDVKKKYPGLRTVLTMGGAYISENFKYFLSNPITLERAATEIAQITIENNFDGIDVDWEMPENGTECNYLLDLVKRLRQLIGDDKILSLSVHFAASNYFGYIEKYEPYLSWFNIMSYSYTGYWNLYSGYNSPLYEPSSDLNNQDYCDKSIREYMSEGVPAHKLVLGIPFYGQAWRVDTDDNYGYNQRGTTYIKGEPDDISNSGLWTYYALRKEGLLTSTTSHHSSWKKVWHTDVKSPTIYNPSTHTFISYDDVDSMCERSYYAKENNLAGVTVWEIGQDYERELISSIIDCFK